MSEDHISEIIVASLLDDLDEKGKQELDRWLNESHLNRNFYESMRDSFFSEKTVLEFSSYDPVKDWVRVKQKFARNRRRILYKRSLYAAVTISVLVSLSILLIPHSDENSELITDGFLIDNTVKESYSAILILSDGNSIDLGNEIEFKDGKIKNNGLVLEYSSQSSAEALPSKPEEHTVKVPYGSEYRVILADGSTVHLNAGSELRYPEYFDGGNRIVELSGEGYFEIMHDPEIPFVVKSGGMSVEVLGTEFNFRCYEGEPRVTTLVNGRLRVMKGEQALEIEPGHQVCEDAGNALYLKTVDPADYTGWRNKRFIFKSSTLEYVMKDIARWYDMDVEFEDERAAQLKLTANIPRYENIESVLGIIREVVFTRIELDGKTITITRDNQ